MSALGQAVVAGKVRALDLEIASKIATGSLRSDALVDGLVTTFVQTLQGSLVNKRRRNSSEWMDQDALVDAMRTLEHGPEAEAILSRFRVNHRSVPKSSFSHSSMPDTFMSMRDRAVLAKTFQSGQSFLKAASQRLHIVFDETTWSPGFQQARSFRDGQDKILGEAVRTGLVFARSSTSSALCRKSAWHAHPFISSRIALKAINLSSNVVACPPARSSHAPKPCCSC